jgi:hypothetical protein
MEQYTALECVRANQWGAGHEGHSRRKPETHLIAGRKVVSYINVRLDRCLGGRVVVIMDGRLWPMEWRKFAWCVRSVDGDR